MKIQRTRIKNKPLKTKELTTNHLKQKIQINNETLIKKIKKKMSKEEKKWKKGNKKNAGKQKIKSKNVRLKIKIGKCKVQNIILFEFV